MMLNFHSKDFVRLNFYSDNDKLIYSCFVNRLSPWFVYFNKLRFVTRFYAHGQKVRFDFPSCAIPCSCLEGLHDMDYFEFLP